MKYKKILYNQLKNNIEPDCEDFYLCEIEEKAKKYDELIDYLKEQIKQCDKDIKRFKGNFEIGNPYDVTALKLEFVYQDINPKIPFFKRYIFVINNEVESIVTREQFNSMRYVVGE